MYSLGIDVGKSGALALLEDSRLKILQKFDKTSFLDMFAFLSKEQWATRAVIERVHAMPKQGSVSMFTFGENFGWIKGCLDMAEISYQEVYPQAWKKEFSLNSDKTKSIDVARQLFPEANLIPDGCKKPDHNMAEALLMAEYARRKLWLT